MMKIKSETIPKLLSFFALVETQFNQKVKIIRSDNDLEFNMSSYYVSKGIIHKRSCNETHQQNGIVEMKHRHLLEVARALKFQANLPLCFWDDCDKISLYYQ